MTNAAFLRDKAAALRVLAREYAPDVGWPLTSKATALERLAAELDRNRRERRQRPLTLRERAGLPAPRLFGRRDPSAPPAATPRSRSCRAESA